MAMGTKGTRSSLVRIPLVVVGAVLFAAVVARFSLSSKLAVSRLERESSALPGMECEKSFAEMVEDVNSLGTSMFRSLQEVEQGKSESGNVFFSPTSIAAAMGLVSVGVTKGSNAQKQILGLLGCGAAFTRDLSAAVGKGSKDVEVAVANSLWTSDLIKLKQTYRQNMESMGVSSQVLPSSVDPVNAWVEKNTMGMIKNLLQSIDPLDRVLLINVLYFKAAWRSPFLLENTRAGTFFPKDGVELSCKMMEQEKTMKFGVGSDGSKTVVLPYKDEFEAWITMPPAGDSDVGDVVEQSKGAKFAYRSIALSLPKFQMEYSAPLVDHLRRLGVSDIFDVMGSLLEVSDAKDLYVSKILHKAVVEVTEEGTKAAAATSVMMSLMSSNVEEPLEFIVDRPFIFSIRHKSGLLLFLGKIVSPNFL